MQVQASGSEEREESGDIVGGSSSWSQVMSLGETYPGVERFECLLAASRAAQAVERACPFHHKTSRVKEASQRSQAAWPRSGRPASEGR